MGEDRSKSQAGGGGCVLLGGALGCSLGEDCPIPQTVTGLPPGPIKTSSEGFWAVGVGLGQGEGNLTFTFQPLEPGFLVFPEGRGPRSHRNPIS